MRHHVPLILFAIVLALLVPTRFTDPIKSLGEGLTIPLAWPTRKVAGLAHGLLFSAGPKDDASPAAPRDASLVYRENEQLRVDVASLVGQVALLRQRAEESERLGRLRELSVRVRVLGSDGGAGSDLNLLATSFGKVEADQPVFTERGLVGRIQRVGPGGSVVRLITHRSTRVSGSFLRYVEADGRVVPQVLPIDQCVATGDGGDGLIIAAARLEQVKALSPGQDWFVLDDPGWPMALNHYRVGKVESVTPSREAPLFAEVRIRPEGVLTQLTEVRVLVR